MIADGGDRGSVSLKRRKDGMKRFELNSSFIRVRPWLWLERSAGSSLQLHLFDNCY